MSIRATLAAVFGAALAAVLLSISALYLSARQIEEVHHRSRWSAEALALHMQLMADAGRYMKEAYELYAQGLNQAPELDAFQARVEQGIASIEALHRSAPIEDPGLEEELARPARMRASFAAIRRGLDALRAARPSGSAAFDDASRAEIERISEDLYEAGLLGELTGAIARERFAMHEHFAQEEQLTARTRLMGVVAAAGLLALLAVLVRWLVRTVDQGVLTLLEGAERIASGSLDRRLRVPDLGQHELGRLAAAFNHMAANLEEAQASRIRAERLAALGQLAASVGHDLRNPLGTIRNAFHYLERRVAGSELGADARLRQMLGVVDREIAASDRIIGNLLDFARERPPALAIWPLRPIVGEAISVVQPQRPVRIENEVPEGLLLELDKDQFRRALVNLIQNATEAVPAGREGLVRITAAVEDCVVLRVIDNGDGIPEELRERIFEPLFSTKQTGTGLGLAITAAVIQRHGADISVQSEPGAGTTFAIRLPQAHAQTGDARSYAGG